MMLCIIFTVFLFTTGLECQGLNTELSQEIHSRRRGIIPNNRRRGDTHIKQLINKDDELVKNSLGGQDHMKQLLIKINSKNKTKEEVAEKSGIFINHRRRRWEYDDTYEWENGGKDYDIPGQVKKETAFEKFAKNWQKHALKAIFLFSITCTLCICLIGCCKTCCLKLWDTMCWHCRDWRDICLNRDPTFRKARKFADDYGIELDYDQYKKIKKNYEDGFRRQGHTEYTNLSGR